MTSHTTVRESGVTTAAVRDSLLWAGAIVLALATVYLLAPAAGQHHATLLGGPRAWWAVGAVVIAGLLSAPRAWPSTVRWVVAAHLCLPLVWVVASGALTDDALLRSTAPSDDHRVSVRLLDRGSDQLVAVGVERPGWLVTYRYPSLCTDAVAADYDVRWSSPTSFVLVGRDDAMDPVTFTIGERVAADPRAGQWEWRPCEAP